MTNEEREQRIKTGRFSNSAFGMPWNKNKSPKNYAKVSEMAKNGKGARG